MPAVQLGLNKPMERSVLVSLAPVIVQVVVWFYFFLGMEKLNCQMNHSIIVFEQEVNLQY